MFYNVLLKRKLLHALIKWNIHDALSFQEQNIHTQFDTTQVNEYIDIQVLSKESYSIQNLPQKSLLSE